MLLNLVLNVVEMMMKGNEEMNVAVGVGTKCKEDVEDDGERDCLEKVEMEVHNQKQNQKKLVRLDSLDQEASHISGMATKTTKALSIAAVMKLAFQSIGVVYGDIRTSPLYVFASTFTDRVPTSDNIIGALSLIIYSLTLFPLIKYVFIFLRANENGDGGTFAMYSLISRHSKVSAIPNSQQGEDEMNLSAYKLQIPTKHLKRAEKIKASLERSSFAKTALLAGFPSKYLFPSTKGCQSNDLIPSTYFLFLSSIINSVEDLYIDFRYEYLGRMISIILCLVLDVHSQGQICLKHHACY
ncbi:potassium transporter 5-like [Macadamia integrifolia]|uniref:potassium transporter 5-like n=1 Tax=Macadamia integrifolia TaxID=60698 RepID=UPI001C4EB3C4|nr:potassium transporter 5-like [Macadamia integrifolia]